MTALTPCPAGPALAAHVQPLQWGLFLCLEYISTLFPAFNALIDDSFPDALLLLPSVSLSSASGMVHLLLHFTLPGRARVRRV
ncbi:hypothetical protein K505DRAFT_329588 [Melanomma pulvis-pyrius CBS 109.77]|uniref:Uncharacterized protein n=1 Tax=Melanomma pulvis-pyrius CBS 109.77 TaxID=1314802 RepID=A0A6A6WUI7_9PLEO|nr:hypothetical protein K505DRAFT_329588 [Melanomma pulvis-pyrius CBS 109.77]